MAKQINLPPSRQAENVIKIRIILLSVAITAIITGSLVYLWQRTNSKFKEKVSEQQINSLESRVEELSQRPTTGPVLMDTSNWSTYVDKPNGFSFKYPAQYSVQNCGPGRETLTPAPLVADGTDCCVYIETGQQNYGKPLGGITMNFCESFFFDIPQKDKEQWFASYVSKYQVQYELFGGITKTVSGKSVYLAYKMLNGMTTSQKIREVLINRQPYVSILEGPYDNPESIILFDTVLSTLQLF